MKNKQIIGIVVAGMVFIAVSGFGILSNYLAGNFAKKTTTANFGSAMGLGPQISLPAEDFIGVIDVVGTIQASSDEGIFSASEGYNHDLYMKFVDKLIDSKNNKGIILYVDSPGGTVYESDELYLKLMEYKEATARPIWAYLASMACSGGYYISMASDTIYANRNCMTGSIGVIMSMYNYKELLDKLGVQEVDITSGANKSMGSGGLDMTEEQKAIFQSMVDESYDQFVGIVAEGRDMDEATVRKLADGRVYTAKQALEAKLIDSIDDYEQMKTDMEAAIEAENVTYYAPGGDQLTNLFSSLFSTYKSTKTKSDAELAKELLTESRNGVLMYYAK